MVGEFKSITYRGDMRREYKYIYTCKNTNRFFWPLLVSSPLLSSGVEQ